MMDPPSERLQRLVWRQWMRKLATAATVAVALGALGLALFHLAGRLNRRVPAPPLPPAPQAEMPSPKEGTVSMDPLAMDEARSRLDAALAERRYGDAFGLLKTLQTTHDLSAVAALMERVDTAVASDFKDVDETGRRLQEEGRYTEAIEHYRTRAARFQGTEHYPYLVQKPDLLGLLAAAEAQPKDPAPLPPPPEPVPAPSVPSPVVAPKPPSAPRETSVPPQARKPAKPIFAPRPTAPPSAKPTQSPLPVFPAAAIGPGAAYYVSPDGSDSNPGTSQAPWRSIQRAADRLSPGDTVYIRAGTYREQVSVRRGGAPGRPVTFHNFPREKPLLDGGKSLGQGGLFEIDGASHVQVVGLAITRSKTHGVKVQGGSHITFQGCEVSFSDHGGVVFLHSKNVLVDRCAVHHNNDIGLSASHEALSLHGVGGFEVRGCRVYENKEEGIDAKVGSSRGSIHHNEVFANALTGIYLDVVSDIDVHANRVYEAKGSRAGITLGVEAYNHKAPDARIRIYNNVIYGNHSGILFWIDKPALEFGAIQDCIFAHNTLHSNQVAGFWVMNSGKVPHKGNVVQGNIFWDNGTEILDEGGFLTAGNTILRNLFRSGARADSRGESPVQAGNVRFANLAAHDYRLAEGSPAIDAGPSIQGISEDCEGKPRPQGAGFDLGAFEFGSARRTQGP